MAKKSSFLDVVKGLTQKKGGKDKEIEKYEKILSEQPDDRNALNSLGDLHAKRGNMEKACEYYLQVGGLYAKDGFTLKAIAVYKKAQRAKPDLVQTYIELADLYVQKGLIGEAKSNYLAAAEMQAAAGAKHESLDTYHKIADLDPDNVKIRSKLAAMYENENFMEDAATIYAEIGDVVIRTDIENGKAFYQRALEIQPENEEILSRIGYAYDEMEMRQEAADIFQKLLEFFPDNIDYKEQFGMLTGEAPAPAPVQEEISLEVSSIEFPEEELTSLNFGEESGPEVQAPQDNVLDFTMGETEPGATADQAVQGTEEHTLDFQIEDQGAISWEDESGGQEPSSSADHALEFPGVSGSPETGAQETSDSSNYYDLASRLDTSVQLDQQHEPPAAPESLKVEAPEKLASSEIGDIIKEFKQGVLEEVGTEDYETHYELGISYKEMSLYDDAIEELKLASLEPSIFVDCQSVMALCYIEKGEFEPAIQALQESRAKVGQQSEKYQDLTYQIANTYEQAGKIEGAAQMYQELFQMNPNYRDVKRRLNKLLA